MLKNSERLTESLHEVQRHESTSTVFLVLKIISSSSFLFFILFSGKKHFSFVVCFRSENNTRPLRSSCARKSTISVCYSRSFSRKYRCLYVSAVNRTRREALCCLVRRPPVRHIVRWPSRRPPSVIR